MKNWDIRFVVVVLSLFTNLVANVACELPLEEDAGSVEVTGSFSAESNLSSKASGEVALTASDFQNYYIYCVSFEENPKAAEGEIDATGRFSLRVPINVAVGCFVNQMSDRKPVASFVVEDTTEGSEDASLALNGNVHLGELNLDLEKGEVKIPRERIAVRLREHDSEASFYDSESLLHNKSFSMECVATGIAEEDAKCAAMLAEDGGQVFFRVLKASKEGRAVEGLGVWASQADFEACGSLDLDFTEKAEIQNRENMMFTHLAVGNAFTDDLGQCKLRDSNGSLERLNLQSYFALGKLESYENYKKLKLHREEEVAANCIREERTELHLKVKGMEEMYAHFVSQTHYEEELDGACSTREEEKAHFQFKLVKN